MSLPVVLARVGDDTIPVVLGIDNETGDTVGYDIAQQKLHKVDIERIEGVVNIDPAAVYFGVDAVSNEREGRMAAEESASLTDQQRHILQSALRDPNGYIEPTLFPSGYKILDALARRGLVEHIGRHMEPVAGPLRYRPGNQYGRVYKNSKIVREDIFRITDAGRAALAEAGSASEPDHSCFPCGLQDAREDRATRFHRVGWKDRDLISLEEYAATFLAEVESDEDANPLDFKDDPRVAVIVSTLQALGIESVGKILGAGSFGTAALLDDHTVIKLTSDPTEIQAGHVLRRKRLKHVARIFESWFIRDVKASTIVGRTAKGKLVKRRNPCGILYVERVQPIPDNHSADQLSEIVNETKEYTHSYPHTLARLDRAEQREKLKKASRTLENILRDTARQLDGSGLVEDSQLAAGVADALSELRDNGVYAIDVHAGNVGYVEDPDTGRTLYKVFDVGSSSPPARPKAQIIDEDHVPRQLELPGMFEEGVSAAEEIGPDYRSNPTIVDSGAEEAGDRESDKDWPAVLAKHKLPTPPGTVLDARWIAGSGDWWIKTSDGWYWLRERGREWVRAPMGPPGAHEEARRPTRYAPKGLLFQPVEGLITGYTQVRPQLIKHRERVPTVETIRLSTIFAVSTIRVQIDVAERRFDCLKELWGDRPGSEFEPWDLEAVKSCFQGMQNGMGDTVLNVSAWAPTAHNAIAKSKFKDRELRRYLAVEKKLPHGLGLAKLSFTLALLGHDVCCLDTRLLERMFGSDANKIAGRWGKRPDGTMSEDSLREYERVEDAFLKGNAFYDASDPVGRARAQWQSWETVGGKGAAHHSWLDVVTGK